MIDLTTLKNSSEKLIALYLTTVYRPMRLVEIVKALGIDRKHIEDLLKNLTKQGVVVKFTEFGSTFYCTPQMGYSVPNNGVSTPHHWGVHAPAMGCAHPTNGVQTPHFGGEESPSSPVNMLTSVNKLNKTNKKDSKVSSGAQAKVSTPSGEVKKAGSAVEDVSYFSPSTAPAVSLPPETPQKIDYADFVAQTTQPPAERTLVRVLPAKAENCHGTVFTPDMTDPTESFYQMFANMQGRMVANPDAMIVAAHLTDYVKPHDVPLIPAEEAFEKYIRILWELIMQAEARGAKNAIKTCDFIVHRAAYLYVMENWDEIPDLNWWTPDKLISYALGRDNRKNFFGHLVGMLSEAYTRLGYGWDTTELYNGQTWKAEIDHCGFKHARRELFPSFFHNQANHTKMGKSLMKSTATGKKAKDFVEEAKPLLHQHRTETERRERHAAAWQSGDVGKMILVRIAEIVGEGRFGLWFGDDTVCSIDEAKEQVVFSMRNAFSAQEAKRQCQAAIDAAIAEYKPGFTPVCVARVMPTVNRDAEIEKMRISAAECNALARARRIPTADEMLSVSSKGGEFRVTEQPIPSWLSKEEQTALRKAMRLREKELFEEFTMKRNGDVALTH